MKSLAVISDVHGNRWALEAVLQDIREQGVTEMMNLGDVIYGPLDPLGTAEILMDLDIPTVQGNEDRILLKPSPLKRVQFVRDQLEDRHYRWLGTFRETILSKELLAFHGTPLSDTEYLLWKTEGGVLKARTGEETGQLLPEGNHHLILCGHDHVQRTVLLPGGALIVNPGSVGLPAYDDHHPVPHAMISGTPHARYSIVRKRGTEYSVEERRVDYQWNEAAASAERNGRPDWALWLKTGIAET